MCPRRLVLREWSQRTGRASRVDDVGVRGNRVEWTLCNGSRRRGVVLLDSLWAEDPQAPGGEMVGSIKVKHKRHTHKVNTTWLSWGGARLCPMIAVTICIYLIFAIVFLSSTRCFASCAPLHAPILGATSTARIRIWHVCEVREAQKTTA